jgi:hypothetical protein
MKKPLTSTDHLENYYESLCNPQKKNIDLNSNKVSKELFKQLAKIHLLGWKFGVLSGRKKRASISEIFQDNFAFFLKQYLPKNFEVSTEDNVGIDGLDCQLVRPDILIKFNGKNIFIIECKTTIGWDRKGPEEKYSKRMDQLVKKFGVLKENIIFVFENHGNTLTGFSEKYWNKKLGQPTNSILEFPYSQIKPLFNEPDPFYWKYEKGFDKKKNYKEFTEESLLQTAVTNIVTPFESIINQILNSVNYERNNLS